MANLRRSLVINFFSSTGTAFLQFVVSVLLARVLSPRDIGVYSMTVVFVGLAHVFRDFGVTAYLQREPDLTSEKIRSATTVVFGTSWSIALAMFLASPSIGRWFNEPAIIPVMRVLAIGFAFIPFGTVTSALLTRNFEAEKQARVNIVSTISYSISCLILGQLGFGSMALAYGNLINIITCGLAYIPYRPKDLPWMPGLRYWRSVAHFGMGSLLSSCVNAINNAVPDILLGKMGTARHVGLLSRANSTVTIFTYVAGSTVSYGAISYLSEAYHRGESLEPVMSRATVLLTGVGWTAMALTTVLGRDIILALYGPKWLESVPAIFPLSLALVVAMMFHYVPMAVTAIGRPYLSAAPALVTLTARICFAVLLFNGSLSGFAWALCLATISAAPVVAWQQWRYLGLNNAVMLRKMLPSAIVAAGTAAAAALLAMVVPALPSLARLLLILPVVAAVWYLLLRVTHHELVAEVHRLATPIKARLLLLRPNV